MVGDVGAGVAGGSRGAGGVGAREEVITETTGMVQG